MKYLFLAFLLVGCSRPNVSYTIFLKEDGQGVLSNLQGENCLESGYQLYNESTRIITFYSNCDVHYSRKLQEFEPDQWQPKKKVYP